MRGILAYGTYVPYNRLQRGKITEALGSGGGLHEPGRFPETGRVGSRRKVTRPEGGDPVGIGKSGLVEVAAP